MTYFSTLLAGGERKCNKSLKNELLIFKLEIKNNYFGGIFSRKSNQNKTMLDLFFYVPQFDGFKMRKQLESI